MEAWMDDNLTMSGLTQESCVYDIDNYSSDDESDFSTLLRPEKKFLN